FAKVSCQLQGRFEKSIFNGDQGERGVFASEQLRTKNNVSSLSGEFSLSAASKQQMHQFDSSNIQSSKMNENGSDEDDEEDEPQHCQIDEYSATITNKVHYSQPHTFVIPDVILEQLQFQKRLLASMEYSYNLKIVSQLPQQLEKIHRDLFTPKNKKSSGIYILSARLHIIILNFECHNNWKNLVTEILVEIYGESLKYLSAKGSRGSTGIHRSVYSAVHQLICEKWGQMIPEKDFVKHINKICNNRKLTHAKQSIDIEYHKNQTPQFADNMPQQKILQQEDDHYSYRADDQQKLVRDSVRSHDTFEPYRYPQSSIGGFHGSSAHMRKCFNDADHESIGGAIRESLEINNQCYSDLGEHYAPI
ncbi:hypothetical protein PV325_005995, partial [Microctonus aethiopoides]